MAQRENTGKSLAVVASVKFCFYGTWTWPGEFRMLRDALGIEFCFAIVFFLVLGLQVELSDACDSKPEDTFIQADVFMLIREKSSAKRLRMRQHFWWQDSHYKFQYMLTQPFFHTTQLPLYRDYHLVAIGEATTRQLRFDAFFQEHASHRENYAFGTVFHKLGQIERVLRNFSELCAVFRFPSLISGARNRDRSGNSMLSVSTFLENKFGYYASYYHVCVYEETCCEQI